jgi:hypothetical protein
MLGSILIHRLEDVLLLAKGVDPDIVEKLVCLLANLE